MLWSGIYIIPNMVTLTGPPSEIQPQKQGVPFSSPGESIDTQKSDPEYGSCPDHVFSNVVRYEGRHRFDSQFE